MFGQDDAWPFMFARSQRKDHAVTFPEGPLYKTQRIEIPEVSIGRLNYGAAYVEIRQVRWPHYIGWEIEHGSTRFGHAGTWGRDNVRDAFRTFASAVEWEARER